MNNAEFALTVDLNTYPLPAVMKAANMFTDDFYIQIQRNNVQAQILFTTKNSSKKYIDSEMLSHEFNNELLNESVHYIIQKETKNLRELILGRALYEECISTEQKSYENKVETNNEINTQKILLAWQQSSEYRENHNS